MNYLYKSILVFALFISSLPSTLKTCHFISLNDVMRSRSDIVYVPCHDQKPFKYKKCPASPYPTSGQPIEGIFEQTFVATIPNAIAYGNFGWIKVGDNFIKDFVMQLCPVGVQVFDFYRDMNQDPALFTLKKIPGRVAVLTTALYKVYGHWLDIVGRLILLQESGVQYDWIYAPKYAEYMKKTYEIYGIPLDKVIDPRDGMCIQADELVVPSLTMRRVPCATDPVNDDYAVTYLWPKWLTDNVRAKIMPIVERMSGQYDFGNKIFISRDDAHIRKIHNEDEIFALFEQQGFKRYSLSGLSFLEQAVMFYNADAVVAAHGSALFNIFFSRPKTVVIEIFQNLFATDHSNLAQQVGCIYVPIKTMDSASWLNVHASTYIAPEIIKKFIHEHALMW